MFLLWINSYIWLSSADSINQTLFVQLRSYKQNVSQSASHYKTIIWSYFMQSVFTLSFPLTSTKCIHLSFTFNKPKCFFSKIEIMIQENSPSQSKRGIFWGPLWPEPAGSGWLYQGFLCSGCTHSIRCHEFSSHQDTSSRSLWEEKKKHVWTPRFIDALHCQYSKQVLYQRTT